MDRRAFLGISAVLATPLSARAQQTGKVYRIGYLALNLAVNRQLHEAFHQGLRDLGYVEGHNLVIESRDAVGKYERLAALAAELVALDVQSSWSGTHPQALAAKKATKTIPIVFASAADPVQSEPGRAAI